MITLSFSGELIAVLALSKLPFVTVGDITQKIDGISLIVENKVRLGFSADWTFEFPLDESPSCHLPMPFNGCRFS